MTPVVPQHGPVLPHARRWLRSHPRLQGLVLAPAGAGRHTPHTRTAVHVLLYHGIPPSQRALFLRQLAHFGDHGRFVSWESMLAALIKGPPPGPSFCLTFDDGHAEWASWLLPELLERNLPAMFFIATGRVVGTGGGALSWSQCRQLVDSGMRVGSHSVTHRRLVDLDVRALRAELADSRAMLEDQLRTPVLDFAVPFGLPGFDFGEREVEAVLEAGYRSLSTALPGSMSMGHSLLDIRRCGVSPVWPLMAARRRVHE